MSDEVRRTITVTGQKEIASGHGERGDWVMYSIDAEGTDGKPILDSLRSFEVLTEGKPIEVEVSRRESEKYGVSYFLKPIRKTSKANELEARVNELERRLKDLEDHVLGMLGGS